MTRTDQVLPRLQVLDQEQIRRIHEAALKILSTTGVRVDSPKILSLLVRETGSKSATGDVVRIPSKLVEWALRAAPSTVKIYNQRGNLAFELGNDRTRFGIGVTTLFYQDPRDDSLVPFSRNHMQQMVRLADSLQNYDVVSTVGIVQDVSPHL